jgi:hypothetical protein
MHLALARHQNVKFTPDFGNPDLLYYPLIFYQFCLCCLWLTSYSGLNKSRIPLIIIFSMETSSTVFHFIGYFVWMLMNKATYSNDCKSDESKICAKSGPILGLIILLLMPLQIGCMVFTLKFTRKQKKKKHLRASQDLKNFDSDRI